jgi:hypothetical protein
MPAAAEGAMRRLSLLFLVACATEEPIEETFTGPVEVDASSFRCITEMTPIRDFYVDNVVGDLEATVDVAENGGEWPVGSVVQLVPFEAMVKREAGFSAASADWEFFFLDVSTEGTEIAARGVEDVENQFGGNCFECHAAAADNDYICGKDNGCVELPLTEELIRNVQDGDVRCGG